MPRKAPPQVALDDARRLWFSLQGLARPRGSTKLTRRALTGHLERTGALQVDTVNVVERAHYLTLWSRFGPYDKRALDRWIYRDRHAYEYWGHEASILPISHLPLGRRRMRRFPKAFEKKSWWPRFKTSAASRRRVLRRVREEGPLESADFERRATDSGVDVWGGEGVPKEDRRSLKILWQSGDLAVRDRRHFRIVYDLAERVYPESETVSPSAYEDHWLLGGLAANGIAPERHLVNYFTAPSLDAASRERVIARNLRKGRVVEVRLEGRRGPCFALPEHLDRLGEHAEPRGTNLICPFDSLLWQRGRALELLDFDYKIEIYVPEAKRRFGYYVLPILHDGQLVGRLDPKLHRDRGVLEVRNEVLEPGFRPTRAFRSGLREALESLAEFLGAERIDRPREVR